MGLPRPSIYDAELLSWRETATGLRVWIIERDGFDRQGRRFRFTAAKSDRLDTILNEVRRLRRTGLRIDTGGLG